MLFVLFLCRFFHKLRLLFGNFGSRFAGDIQSNRYRLLFGMRFHFGFDVFANRFFACTLNQRHRNSPGNMQLALLFEPAQLLVYGALCARLYTQAYLVRSPSLLLTVQYIHKKTDIVFR